MRAADCLVLGSAAVPSLRSPASRCPEMLGGGGVSKMVQQGAPFHVRRNAVGSEAPFEDRIHVVLAIHAAEHDGENDKGEQAGHESDDERVCVKTPTRTRNSQRLQG